MDFYQGVFGMPLLTRQEPGMNISAGAGFLGIYPAPAGTTTGSINHLCFGMENFDADAVLKKLTDRGIKASIRLRGDTKELYFTDPDGIRVQLQDVKYKGGAGPLGDQ
jgi:catechol 2,3-dioxygenase-like lactoylglutathione lyase family enzyme